MASREGYVFRRHSADGELIERFEGGLADAFDRARDLAASLGCEVNVWCERFGATGSVRVFPTDARILGKGGRS